MKFWKMNGAGNDFLILNNLEEHLPQEDFPRLARTLCERRLSIGADGLMVVEAPTQGGDYKMLFFNSDGTVGEMCGNGASAATATRRVLPGRCSGWRPPPGW